MKTLVLIIALSSITLFYSSLYADEEIHKIVFSPDEWLEIDGEYGPYGICLGSMSMVNGKEQCTRVVANLSEVFGERVLATKLPLQVFIEKREGHAVIIESAGPATRGIIGRLEVSYKLNRNGSPIKYEIPSRTTAQIKIDDAIIYEPTPDIIEPAKPEPITEGYKSITFGPDEYFTVDNDSYKGYAICLGGMRRIDGEYLCVRAMPGLEGLAFGKRLRGTVLPLQVFIEAREDGAVVVENTSIIEYEIGSRKRLRVRYRDNEGAALMPYTPPDRSQEQVEFDDRLIEGPGVSASTFFYVQIILLSMIVFLASVAYSKRKRPRRNIAGGHRAGALQEAEREYENIIAQRDIAEARRARVIQEAEEVNRQNRTIEALVAGRPQRTLRGTEARRISELSEAPKMISTSEPEEIKMEKNKRKVIL